MSLKPKAEWYFAVCGRGRYRAEGGSYLILQYNSRVLIRSLYTAEKTTLTRIISQGCNGISEGPYVLS
jgi:hypothetical protein